MRIKQKIELDISQMSQSDLKSLQKSDPFMYHSIPAVYRANLSLESFDHLQMASSLASEASRSSSVVHRKSRLTTECHDSLLLQDLLEDEELVPQEFELPAELAALLGSSSGGSGCKRKR